MHAQRVGPARALGEVLRRSFGWTISTNGVDASVAMVWKSFTLSHGLCIEARIDRSASPHRWSKQRVTVRCGFCARHRCRHHASRRAVFDHDRLVHLREELWPILRANTSVVPPGACGTISFTILEGYGCAAARARWSKRQRVRLTVRRIALPPYWVIGGRLRGEVLLEERDRPIPGRVSPTPRDSAASNCCESHAACGVHFSPGTPAAFSAFSYSGHIALMRSSFSAYWIR